MNSIGPYVKTTVPEMHLQALVPVLSGLYPVQAALLANPADQCMQLLGQVASTDMQVDISPWADPTSEQGWLLAEQDGPATYHHLSLVAESGLIPAETLQCCWPNIRTLATHVTTGICLDSAVDRVQNGTEPNTNHRKANWLWLGCLPALPLLRGATACLAHTDVLFARVITHAAAQADSALEPLREYLLHKHFTLLCIQPERNPALATAVFVRQHKPELIQQLKQEVQAKQALQAKLDAEAKALAEAKAQAQQLSTDKATLQTQKDAEAKAKAEAQQKLDAESKAKAESNTQRDLLVKEKAALTAARDEQAKLAAERLSALTAHQQAAFNKQKQLQLVETENKEFVARQLLMKSELSKAEAQIELMKELFLRDQRS